MSYKIKNFMIKEVITIGPLESIKRAETIMMNYRIGGLPVVEGLKLIGIITSFDVRCSHPNRLVIDAMTKNPISIKPNHNLIEAKKILEKHNIERLPVINDAADLIGLITKSIVYKEIGKHFDLLTGLATNQLIISNSIELFEGSPDIVCLFFDIDNFGNFNKLYGHVIGDEIIKEVSKTLLESIDACSLCRYGGDEFAAILSCSLDEAKAIARKISLNIANNQLLNEFSVSISTGIAGGRRKCLRDEEDIIKNIKKLINLASLASTKAKTLNLDFAVADKFNLAINC